MYSARRGAITHAINVSGNIALGQRLARHASSATTSAFYHKVMPDTMFLDGMKKLNGKANKNMGRKPNPVRLLFGFTRQELQDCRELAAVSEEAYQAAIAQARAEAKEHGRYLTEGRIFRILGIGRERRRKNVGSANEIPEHIFAWAASLTPEERRTITLALQLTKPR